MGLLTPLNKTVKQLEEARDSVIGIGDNGAVCTILKDTITDVLNFIDNYQLEKASKHPICFNCDKYNRSENTCEKDGTAKERTNHCDEWDGWIDE